MLKKFIFRILLCGCTVFVLPACGDDELDPESIFSTEEAELDPNSASYELDKWLEDNYLKPYNLQFRYKMQDVGTDMNYNLVPATYSNSVDLAVLTKYLWFDVYDKVVSPDFLKLYGPRIIHLIGSPAYNPANGTMILGLAEGGLKVSLFRVNSMDVTDFNMLNEYYFQTMHHEFAHILHQTRTYPREFDEISVDYYDPMGWQNRNMEMCYSLGFTSDYASSEAREDFAETIANYITKTDEQWNYMLEAATYGWQQRYDDNGLPVEDASGKPVCDQVADFDGVDGRAVILQKVQIARDWFRDAWNMDLDALRAEVQYRQLNYNLDELRSQVYDILPGDGVLNGAETSGNN